MNASTGDLRLDSWMSVLGSFSTQRQRLNQLTGGWYAGQAQEQYANDGLAALIVDRIAEDALSRGFEVEGDEDHIILDEIDRLDAITVLTDGLRWSRLHGAGAVLVLVEDGSDLAEPLLPERIRTILDLVAYPASALNANPARYIDPTRSNYGEPISFQVQPRSGLAFEVHESRLLRLPGDPLSYNGAVQHAVPWMGRSALQACWCDLLRYREALGLAQAILERKQQPVYQMQGLGEMMAAGLDDVVKARLALTDMVRGILTTVAVDAEDKYTIADSGLAGVGEVMRDFKIALSASSGIPLAVLFGEMAGGLTTTDEGASAIYHSRVRQTQERCLRPALERLVSLIWAQRSVSQREPPHWSIQWNQLYSPKETDVAAAALGRANAHKAEVEALDAMLTAQVMIPDEVRDYLRREWPDLQLPSTPAPEPEPIPAALMMGAAADPFADPDAAASPP